MLSMLNTTDWIIILIAIIAAVIALGFLFPQTKNHDMERIRSIRQQAENDQQQIKQILETLYQSTRDADYLSNQLKERIQCINKDDQQRITQHANTERLLEQARESERELRSASTSLGQRLQQIQEYWDDQLDDTVDSVKQIRERLKEGLLHVDDGIIRLREQEKMAQGFTQKLIEHYQKQANNQQYNSELSTELRQHLELMLQESHQSLAQIRQHQENADLIFKTFAVEMEQRESEANDHFSQLYQTTDVARQELNAGLDEARHHLEALRRREEQSNAISQQIRQQASKVEGLNIEHLTRTIASTNKLCGELQENVAQARQALNIFDDTMTEVKQSLQQVDAVNQQEKPKEEVLSSQNDLPQNKPVKQLFALRSHK